MLLKNHTRQKQPKYLYDVQRPCHSCVDLRGRIRGGLPRPSDGVLAEAEEILALVMSRTKSDLPW
jgi:hypothetical protein